MTRSVFAIEPGKQEIVGTRTFDVPRDLVFKTMTDPNLIPQWSTTTSMCRSSLSIPSSTKASLAIVLLETVTLEEVDGKTRLTDHMVFQSVSDRDRMVQNGMESGATETMDRLEELLAAGHL